MDITEKYRKYLFPSINTYYQKPLEIISGKGCIVKDCSGKEYLDLFAGILTLSIGHSNTYVGKKVDEQLKKLQHTSSLYVTEPVALLAEKIAHITDYRLTRSFFTNSGTEANETAVLTARMHTASSDIIALRHSYSGRSALTMSLSGNSNYRLGNTFAQNIHHALTPYCYRCPFHMEYPECDCACADDIEQIIHTQTSGNRLAGLIAEPILGVGGFIVPPDGYFQKAYEIIKKYGGLFISDEVQTGWGRTGKYWFGIEHWNVFPDIITSAKGFANGFPIGLTLTSDIIANSLKGSTISTFGGNPISTTAGLAVLEYIEQENLLQKVDKLGKYFIDALRQLKSKYPIIGDVRGMGLMIGLEIVGENKIPDSKAVDLLFEYTKQEGILIGRGGLYSNVIRIAPPLTINKSQIDDAVILLDNAFSKYYDKRI